MSSKVGVECFGRFGPFFSVDGVDVSVEWATKMAGSTVGVEWLEKARKWV